MIGLKIGTFMSQPNVLCLGEDTCLLSDVMAFRLGEGKFHLGEPLCQGGGWLAPRQTREFFCYILCFLSFSSSFA